MQRETELVGQWHDVFGVPRREPGVTPFAEIPISDFRLRINLIQEEVGELVSALDGVEEDRVEIIDGCADAMYVVAGSFVQIGLVPAEGLLFREMASTEISRVLTQLVESLESCIEETQDVENGTLQRASHSIVLRRFKAQSVHLELLILGLCAKLGLDYERAFAEVHRSNMSKANPDGSVTRREDGKVIKSPTYSPADLSFALT